MLGKKAFRAGLALAPATFLFGAVGWGAAQHFDLGGPCVDSTDAEVLTQARLAKKNGSWSRAIELEKLVVRGGCRNAYRWLELANMLVEARRPVEALQALEEMDSRNFDLNPSLLNEEQTQLKDFMDTPLFSDSALGRKIARLKKISDERRVQYRELLNSLSAEERPHENYVAIGVCPFECCRYGDWSVTEDTDLVSAPGNPRVVGKVRRGTHVVGVTGEVHLKPEPVVVLMDGVMPKGSIAFVLDSEGEGYGHVYTRGKVVNEFLAYSEYCFRVSDSCWGETILPAGKQPKQVWWVKVRLANGLTGWTDKTDHFGGNDSCA